METKATGSTKRLAARRRVPWPVRLVLAVLAIVLFGIPNEVHAKTVTATWNANPESNIAGYKLSYGTQSATYTVVLDVGNVTSRQLSLPGPQRYYFAVQAYNTSGLISGYSTEVFFDVPAGPALTSLSPTSGLVGTSVTITGTNFGATQGTSTVRFNGVTAAPASWSATSIVVPVPAGATTGNVVVTVGGDASNGLAFAVYHPRDLTDANDFDGDKKSDVIVFRPDTGTWYILKSSSGFQNFMSKAWGTSSDIPVPGDYDGDGKTDIAMFKPSTGVWWLLLSSTNFASYTSVAWGASADIPVAGDYDGDGKTDIAIYRPSTGVWWVLRSSSNYTTYFSYSWGSGTDIPVPGDYDGDRKTDIAMFKPSTGEWWVLRSSSNYTTYFSYSWGMSADIPMPSDYDGDGKTDLAIYRPGTAVWYLLSSKSNYSYSTAVSVSWGDSTDRPVVGDYDGDGKADLALYTTADGWNATWEILLSGSNYSTSMSMMWGFWPDWAIPLHR